MGTRTVLFVGGPFDGQRLEVDDFARFISSPGLPRSGAQEDTYPAAEYQITKFRGAEAYTCYIATLGTDTRDPMQILFENYGKAGA